MPEWISPAISALVVLIGLGTNLVLTGRLIGKFSEQQANLVAAQAKLAERVDEFEGEVEGEASLRSAFEVRLGTVERGLEVFWGVRDQITAMRAAGEVEDRHTREKLDSLARGMSTIERQMATISRDGLAFRPPRDGA